MKDPPLQSTMDLKFLFFFVIVVNCLPYDYEYTDDDEYDEYVDPKTKSTYSGNKKADWVVFYLSY